VNTDKSRGQILAVLAALVVGAGIVAAPAAADTTLTVGKPAATADNLIVVDVGKDLGIFKKHGLNLKILNFRGTAPLVQAIAAGSVDVGLADGTIMAFIVKGAPMTAVCENTAALPMMSIGVPYDSPIKSLVDLKGKKIGISSVGSLTDWVVLELARAEGWGSDGVTRVTIGAGPAASGAAFRTYQIDASVEGTTSFLIEEKDKVARILALVSSFTNIDIGGVYASNHLIESDPDAVRAFLAALMETTQFIMTHKDETVELWTKVTGFPKEVMPKEYDLVKGMWNKDCRFNRESLGSLRHSFVELKILDSEPDMSKLYTEAYLPENASGAAAH
jgi:ABC-type nitrate/sulfonate/bicarbonate transport system substrate-binding protein